MRIAFLWDWDIVPEHAITWKDGLARAIQILGTRHEVAFFAVGTYTDYPHEYFTIRSRPAGDVLVKEIEDFKPDVILHWADFTRMHARPLSKLGIPMALCFAGGNTQAENCYRFSHVFFENEEYKAKFEQETGISCSIAFGANTELFSPKLEMKKQFDVCNFSVFADWKRHKLLIQSTLDIDRELRVVCSGHKYYDHEQYCWQYPMSMGALILPNMSADAVSHMMAASKVCLLTSSSQGGSQRTVLEAMAMNIPLVICDDSSKLLEYVKEGGGFVANHDDPRDVYNKIIEAMNVKDWNTRDYILSKWTENHYADAIEKGLYGILQG